LRKRRLFSSEKTRNYRKDRTRPKRGKASIKLDYGQFEKELEVTFPKNAQITERFHDKRPNPDIETIWCGRVVLKYYKTDGKGFIYGMDGTFAGGFEKHDLRRAWKRIGDLLKKIK
jgi:hypothetical protein